MLKHFHTKYLLLFLSILSSFVLLELLIRIAGVVVSRQKEYAVQKEKNSYVIMTLGESTTASDTPYSWPEQMQEILTVNYPDRSVRVVNKAVSGTNTTRILGNIEAQIRQIKPDLIITMMGINDERESQFRNTLYIPNIKNNELRIGRLYRLIGKYWSSAVRRIFDLHIFANSDDLLAKSEEFQRYGDFEEAEIYLKQYIQITSGDALGYMQLGLLYREMERNKEAEHMLRKALSVAGNKEGVYYELGNYYRDNGNSNLGEEMYKNALVLDSRYGLAYGGLAMLYHWRGDTTKAEAMYMKAIEYNPEIVSVYSEFAYIYREQGYYSRAIELYDQALVIEPGDTLASRERAITLQMMSGNVAGVTTERNETHLADMQPVTRHNYQKLIQITGTYNIPLVIMGYPMQSVDSLRKLASGNNQVAVISNNDNFRKALMTQSYNDLFTDYFGGNFGHATWYGNRLIAKNAAEEFNMLIGAGGKSN